MAYTIKLLVIVTTAFVLLITNVFAFRVSFQENQKPWLTELYERVPQEVHFSKYTINQCQMILSGKSQTDERHALLATCTLHLVFGVNDKKR